MSVLTSRPQALSLAQQWCTAQKTCNLMSPTTGAAPPSGIDWPNIDPRAQAAIELLGSPPAAPAKIKEISKYLNISVSRLQHLFKEAMGIPFSRYRKLLQMQRAKQLFETSFLSVKEVAAAVGAEDLSHFRRDYKSLFGETPGQTRKNSQRRRLDPGFAGRSNDENPNGSCLSGTSDN